MLRALNIVPSLKDSSSEDDKWQIYKSQIHKTLQNTTFFYDNQYISYYFQKKRPTLLNSIIRFSLQFVKDKNAHHYHL